MIKRREICSVLHRKVAEPHSSVCHRRWCPNVRPTQIGSPPPQTLCTFHRVGSWLHHGRGSAGALAQRTESLAQRRVRWETPLVVREPRPTKKDGLRSD